MALLTGEQSKPPTDVYLGLEGHVFDAGTLKLPYRFGRPTGYDAGKKYPLVVFLHGYGADGKDLIEIGRQWRPWLPDAAFVAPNAPEPCAMSPMGRQWFALSNRRPDEREGADERWAGVVKARPALGSQAPGTFWYYNNWDFNTLGTIYEQATGSGVYEALDRLIARPIGMQDYRPQDGVYFPGAASDHRAYPLRMSARDLARFALLYLNKGAWAGKQIVPADWVRESTRPYSVQPSSGFGYGYLWWTAPVPPGPDGIPEGTFFAWGAGGQHAFVIPAYDLVVVNRVDRDMRLPEPKLSEVKQLLSLTLKAGPFGR